MVEPMDNEGMKGNYNFRMEMANSVEFFGTEHAWQTIDWVVSLKRAKKTVEEVSRTSDGKLKRNIDFYFELYRKKQGEEINSLIEQESSKYLSKIKLKKTAPQLYLEVMTKCQTHFIYVKQSSTVSPWTPCSRTDHSTSSCSSYSSKTTT
jgi:hypothetical protein